MFQLFISVYFRTSKMKHFLVIIINLLLIGSIRSNPRIETYSTNSGKQLADIFTNYATIECGKSILGWSCGPLYSIAKKLKYSNGENKFEFQKNVDEKWLVGNENNNSLRKKRSLNSDDLIDSNIENGENNKTLTESRQIGTMPGCMPCILNLGCTPCGTFPPPLGCQPCTNPEIVPSTRKDAENNETLTESRQFTPGCMRCVPGISGCTPCGTFPPPLGCEPCTNQEIVLSTRKDAENNETLTESRQIVYQNSPGCLPCIYLMGCSPCGHQPPPGCIQCTNQPPGGAVAVGTNVGWSSQLLGNIFNVAVTNVISTTIIG